jgi:hypothetical protein
MTRKTDVRSSQKWSDNVSSSKASLPQNVFGLASLQHNSTLNALLWPQTGLGYIAGKLVTHLQLPPKFRLQNYPITPKNGENTLKIGLITIKTQKLVINPLSNYNMGAAPFNGAPPWQGHMDHGLNHGLGLSPSPLLYAHIPCNIFHNVGFIT